eukprot:TRINITY_DN46_c0_g2_i2.p1 TRINITY_DN46_c0_g2~~TRINITY_DN46_c0_g2_i2.p1  ORF type:complete len:340 (+),score=70.17 TRINITY_DN46_c0_g2_i2:79-1098(+)
MGYGGYGKGWGNGWGGGGNVLGAVMQLLSGGKGKGKGKGKKGKKGKGKWMFIEDDEDDDDNYRGRRKKGRGKGKREGRKNKKRRANVREEAPEKLHGDCWEEPRESMGLRLVKEMAPAKYKWRYEMSDESRRSFAGYLPSPMPQAQCKSFFERIKAGTDWLQPEGPLGPIPRKTAWMVKKGCSCPYHYGQIEVPPAEYPPWMHDLMRTVMPCCGLDDYEDWPDSCNINLYTDGGMSVGWHSDDEKIFQGKFRDILIISLSLGVKRQFELRTNWPEEGEKKDLRRMSLGSGDLMTMEGMVQKHFQHRVPKEDNIQGPRINLTWRWVMKHTPKCPAGRNRY